METAEEDGHQLTEDHSQPEDNQNQEQEHDQPDQEQEQPEQEHEQPEQEQGQPEQDQEQDPDQEPDQAEDEKDEPEQEDDVQEQDDEHHKDEAVTVDGEIERTDGDIDPANSNNNAGDEQEDGSGKQEDGNEQAEQEDGSGKQEEGNEQAEQEDGSGKQEEGNEQAEQEDDSGKQEYGNEQAEQEDGSEHEDAEMAQNENEGDKDQQTTPKPTSAQSVEIPTQAEDAEEEEESPHLEDKKTPEPPTEHISTGMDPEDGDAMDQEEKDDHMPMEHQAAPSPMLQYDHDATATVKFVLLPTQQVATLRCYLTQTLYDLKEHFAQELKISASSILLMLDGKGTADRMTLGELGVGPNGTIRLEMQSADPDNQPIKAFKPRQEYTMPDVISVRVASDGVIKDVVVEIERSNKKKAFLGGYRHKKTNVEFHHASAQTAQKPRPPPAIERYCRDTQTVTQKHVVQQTTNNMATQMTKIGVYISNLQDQLRIPGKYTTADEYKMNMLQKVIVIQKYYRRWLAKRYVEKVRDDQESRIEWERAEEIRKKKEKEDRIRREFERRMNPKTKEDFDLLYHALEKWRQEEMNTINETLTGAERKAALCQLLDQETQLIASIGRHKLEADDEQKQKQVQGFLENAASPKKWKGPDGKQTEMDTPYTIRAQELKDIYNSINMKYLTQDERLDVLLTLKHTVKEHDCKLTQEVIELIDREADLLMRGVKESNLEGLRRRISTLFLQYIKTPTFNPEAARLLKVPQDPTSLRKNIYFCPSCNQYLPSTEFQLSSNSRAVGKCRKCNKTDNDARVRQDYSHYRYMLKSIRRSEEAYEDESKIAFLMQENDLRYLVENVWNSQSVLSAWEDLYDLVLVRWDRHQEWAPWNSILLTKEESTAHEKLEHLDEAYGKVFVHKVKHKHTLSRNYFSRMPGMAEHMRTRNNSALPNGPAISGTAIASAKA